jgi:hypothetical protein
MTSMSDRWARQDTIPLATAVDRRATEQTVATSRRGFLRAAYVAVRCPHILLTLRLRMREIKRDRNKQQVAY